MCTYKYRNDLLIKDVDSGPSITRMPCTFFLFLFFIYWSVCAYGLKFRSELSVAWETTATVATQEKWLQNIPLFSPQERKKERKEKKKKKKKATSKHMYYHYPGLQPILACELS